MRRQTGSNDFLTDLEQTVKDVISLDGPMDLRQKTKCANDTQGTFATLRSLPHLALCGACWFERRKGQRGPRGLVALKVGTVVAVGNIPMLL